MRNYIFYDSVIFLLLILFQHAYSHTWEMKWKRYGWRKSSKDFKWEIIKKVFSAFSLNVLKIHDNRCAHQDCNAFEMGSGRLCFNRFVCCACICECADVFCFSFFFLFRRKKRMSSTSKSEFIYVCLVEKFIIYEAIVHQRIRKKLWYASSMANITENSLDSMKYLWS